MSAPDHATAEAGKAALDVALPDNHDPSPSPAAPSEIYSDTEKAPIKKTETAPRNIHGIKWALAVSSVLISTFLFALDNTIVADIQPAIVNDFGEVSKLSWLSVSFLVAAIGTNLFW